MVPVSFKILSFVILKFVVDLPPGQVQYLEAFREIGQRQRAAYVEMHISMYSCKNYVYYLFLFLNFVQERGRVRERERWKEGCVCDLSRTRAIPFFLVKLLLFKFESFREESARNWYLPLSAAPLWVEYIYTYIEEDSPLDSSRKGRKKEKRDEKPLGDIYQLI